MYAHLLYIGNTHMLYICIYMKDVYTNINKSLPLGNQFMIFSLDFPWDFLVLIFALSRIAIFLIYFQVY